MPPVLPGGLNNSGQMSRQMSSTMMGGARMNQIMNQPVNFDPELGSTNWQPQQQTYDNFLNANTQSNSSMMMMRNYEPQLNTVTADETDQAVEDFLYD